MNTEQMLEVILQKINTMDARMENVENKIDSMDARMESVENKIESMDARLDSIDARVKLLEPLSQQVKEIQLTLENEISKKINIIAEGHLNLSRKLDEAMGFQKREEMICLRITSLEGDVQRIKSRIGMSM
ncbi:hypothetical protein AALB64_03280 [Lachnospiraceae bacterium 45-P1]